MSGPNGEACRDCYFWESTTDGSGCCNRYPPLTFINDEMCRADFVSNYSDQNNWCGEYKEREATNDE